MPQDDWAVVEEALRTATAVGGDPQREKEALMALARLREREARLTEEGHALRGREVALEKRIRELEREQEELLGLGDLTLRTVTERKIAAEARVAELENKLNEDSQAFHIETLKAERELLHARVARLEEALREIDGETQDSEVALIARRALNVGGDERQDPGSDGTIAHVPTRALAHEEKAT